MKYNSGKMENLQKKIIALAKRIEGTPKEATLVVSKH